MNKEKLISKLTGYALHCGYVAFKDGYSISVLHNMYVVKGYGLEDVYFNTLLEARKHIRK